jgi:hypothetical protein
MTVLRELQKKIAKPSMYVVDIGASSCVASDPVYEFLVDKEFQGLCVEGNKEKVEFLRTRTHFDVYDNYIYPHTIVDVFQQYGVPSTFDVLKIDIDGYDLEVLRRILAVYKPRIIIAEINEKIPPPIRFEVLYKEDYSWDNSHFYGFSIAAGEKVFAEHGYRIKQIYELVNIICIDESMPSEALPSIKDMYKEQYINDPEREKELWWNNDINYWFEIDEPDELAVEIGRYFQVKNQRSIRNEKKQVNIDYSLEY